MNNNDPTGKACFCGLKSDDRIVDAVNSMSPKERLLLAKFTLVAVALPLVSPALESSGAIAISSSVLRAGLVMSASAGGVSALSGGSPWEVGISMVFGFSTGLQIASVSNWAARVYFGTKGSLLTTAFTKAITGEKPKALDFIISSFKGLVSTVNPTAGLLTEVIDQTVNNKSSSENAPPPQKKKKGKGSTQESPGGFCRGTRIGNFRTGSIC